VDATADPLRVIRKLPGSSVSGRGAAVPLGHRLQVLRGDRHVHAIPLVIRVECGQLQVHPLSSPEENICFLLFGMFASHPAC